MIIIVTGGRDYKNQTLVIRVLETLKPTKIVQGGATGADAYARGYAKATRTSLKTYLANWFEHGKAAGPKRNREMLEENLLGVVLAFKGGAGTENCVKQARELNMLVLRVEE